MGPGGVLFFMRIKLPLFDNPTVRRLHPLCRGGTYGILEGIQLLYAFPNGYGASVVQHAIQIPPHVTYMPGEYTYELAVLNIGPMGFSDPISFDLCYDTEITGDVVKPLRPTDVEVYLQRIKILPLNTDYGKEGTE